MDRKDKKKLCCGVFILLILEIPDLVLDWDFYVEIVRTDQKVIQDNQALKLSILVFCCIASFAFVLEFINLLRNIFSSSLFFFPAVFSLITTLCEDLPQIILALYVAIIEDEHVHTNLQYAKAGFSIFEAFVRNALLIWYIFRKNQKAKVKPDDQELQDSTKAKVCVPAVTLTVGLTIMICATFIMLQLTGTI